MIRATTREHRPFHPVAAFVLTLVLLGLQTFVAPWVGEARLLARRRADVRVSPPSRWTARSGRRGGLVMNALRGLRTLARFPTAPFVEVATAAWPGPGVPPSHSPHSPHSAPAPVLMRGAWGRGTAEAITRWWAEIPVGERADVLALPAGAALPEPYVVDLLLYGARPPTRRRRTDLVAQPEELRVLIDSENAGRSGAGGAGLEKRALGGRFPGVERRRARRPAPSDQR